MAIGLAVGAVLALLGWEATRDLFAATAFEATNHRGKALPVGVGVLLALVAIAAEAAFGLAAAGGHGPGAPGARLLVLLAVVAYALLGLVDDLGAHGSDRGFGGHVRALAAGRLTTGGLKLVGGGLVALAVAGAIDSDNPWHLIADAALIALCANLGNLFDRAPGRTIKVSMVAFVVLAAITGAPRELVGPAVVVGAAVGLLAFDLREDFMLGDAGANPLGAALGVGVALTVSFGARLGVLVVVAALNVASEVVSFTTVIERVPLLRALDRMGRRP